VARRPAHSQPHPRILIVEDDDFLAEAIEALLRSLGEVTRTARAEDALRLVGEREWDVVVSDIELPGISGLEFVERSKSARPELSILILSSHASFDFAVTALRAGAADYMTKPADPGALVEKVGELIEQTREGRSRGHEVILAVGAHPDDVEIGVGGILLRHAAAGHSVAVLTLTGGEAGGTAEDRRRESQAAAELMSARLFHADLDDTSITEGKATIRTIKRVLDEVDPTTVYTHTPRDVHQDHRNVHQATLVAARGIPRLYCYQAPSTTVDFHPTRFVDIDHYLEPKLEVIRAFGSQVAVRGYLDEELLRATARYWARFTRSRYVEPLEVVRESDTAGGAAPALAGTEGLEE
jgi:LmbE family N-acetylglucosaminyl deacetylase/CheY-like chemotaxis protein